MLMNRWTAFGIHLTLSVVVFSALLGVISMLWFPGILFSIDGGWSGLRLIMAVDVVLGPLLTLIVFKPGKPGLKFDLSCIAAAQVCGLLAGIWIVHDARPLVLLQAYDTMYSLGAREFETFGEDPALLDGFSGSYPKLLYAQLPENEFSAEVINLRGQFLNDPLFMQTERYRSMPPDAGSVFRWADSVRQSAREILGGETVDQLDEQGCLLSYFVSPYTNGLVCFDPRSRRLTRFFALQNDSVEPQRQ